MLCLHDKHTGYTVFRFYVSFEYIGKTNASQPPFGSTIVSPRFTKKTELC